MNDELQEWEEYGTYTWRMNVEGGCLYLYLFDDHPTSMCFVPDVDLTRYQAHLRDAYKKGYEDGQLDAQKGIKEDVSTSSEL